MSALNDVLDNAVARGVITQQQADDIAAGNNSRASARTVIDGRLVTIGLNSGNTFAQLETGISSYISAGANQTQINNRIIAVLAFVTAGLIKLALRMEG